MQDHTPVLVHPASARIRPLKSRHPDRPAISLFSHQRNGRFELVAVAKLFTADGIWEIAAGHRFEGRDAIRAAFLGKQVRAVRVAGHVVTDSPSVEIPSLLHGQSSRDALHWVVIKTFADKRTAQLFLRGRAKGFPPDVARRAVRKIEYVDLATRLADLKTPPGNRRHALRGDRQGQYAVAVNDQWRICFRFVDGGAFDVEICDYH